MKRFLPLLFNFKAQIVLWFGYGLLSCVYFNTFYNAETSFTKALQIIEESPILDNENLPHQAKQLLGEAIENSQMVIKKYPESKYVDDAVFIIARASFLRDEVAVAERYFKQLLQFYPDSKFHSMTEVWLAYTHLRMGLVDSAHASIQTILTENPGSKQKQYLIYNVLAEISGERDSIISVYENYEQAAKYAPSNSKKTATFGKLVKIAEDNNDIEAASGYLVQLGKVAPNNIRIDAKLQWITYQRELRNFEKIISEIESMLGLSEFQGKRLILKLELGKVYKDQGNLSAAKDMFSQLVEEYSRKNETAEAYYHLGYMALREDFNLDLAREYFENSKTERSQSKYGKESKALLKKIDNFEDLLSEFKELLFTEEDEGPGDQDPKPESMEMMEDKQSPSSRPFQLDQLNIDLTGMMSERDFDAHREQQQGAAPSSADSLLFTIGEMLLYDFSHIDLAMEKFVELTEKFPQSKFAPQSLYVLSHYQPNGDWQNQLKSDYPLSSFNEENVHSELEFGNELLHKRDLAWEKTSHSFESSYLEFQRLFNEENDTLSLYISAFISDYYLSDIEKTVQHYQAYIDSFPDYSYYSATEVRLAEIKENLEEVAETSRQGLKFLNAVIILQKESDFDSVKVLLTELTSGSKSKYKTAANSLKSVFRDYDELVEEIQIMNAPPDSASMGFEIMVPPGKEDEKLDSLFFRLAELFAFELELNDSANYYHKNLIEQFRDSKFRSQSLLYLADVDKAGNWSNLLLEDYPDTTFIADSTHYLSVYPQEIFQDDFIEGQEEIIRQCEAYLLLFPQPLDTSLLAIDSAAVVIDTTIILDSIILTLDSIKIPEDMPILPTDSLGPEIPAEKGENY